MLTLALTKLARLRQRGACGYITHPRHELLEDPIFSTTKGGHHNENGCLGRRDSTRSFHRLVRSPFALFPRGRRNQLGSSSEWGCYLLIRLDSAVSRQQQYPRAVPDNTSYMYSLVGFCGLVPGEGGNVVRPPRASLDASPWRLSGTERACPS